MMDACKVLFLVALCCLGALGLPDTPSTEKPVTIILKTNEPDASKGTSTSIVDVDKKKTTTSTTTTTTTTPAPTTTTPAPTTTTPAPTTPPPPPTPPGPPELGVWSVSKSNVTCVVVQFTASLNITIPVDSKNMSHVIMNVPVNNTLVDGDCGNLTQWITISWPNDTKANNLSMYFHKNESTHQYHLSSVNVSLTVDPKLFHNISVIHLQHSTAEWEVPLQTSYRCAASTQLGMTVIEPNPEASSLGATVTLTRLQEQAFRSTNDTTFSAARNCGGNDLPDAVPIAVGCALGGLVVVVLVAYLVGRRRSAARGYLSM